MWNFRIIKKGKGKDAYFGIYEVFYDEKGNPNACTEDPVDVSSESINGIKWVLKKMILGSKKPVLEYDMFEKMKRNI